MFHSPRRILTVCAAGSGLLLTACMGLNFADSDDIDLAVNEPYPAGRSVAPAASEPSAEATGRDGSVEGAVAASLPFLLREGRAWMDGKAWVQDGTGCVSCHQVPFTLWARGASTRVGLSAASETWTGLGTDALAHTLANGNGRPGIFAPLLLADVADALPPDDRRESLRRLADLQERDGRWRARGQFPSQRRPLAETDEVITLWTLLAVQNDVAVDRDLGSSRARALAWLETQDRPPEARSTEWLAARTLLAARSQEAGPATSLLGEVLARQNDDGGWGFLADDPSDALTTGQVLYAVSLGSVDTAEVTDALRRGTDFLLRSQNDDGSWTVPSRLFSEEPSDRNDYVYGVWGTAWATIGLSQRDG